MRPPALTARRFYKSGAIKKTDAGFALFLDEKPATTPAGKPLAAPNAELGAAILGEWSQAEERIEPAKMVMTRLAATAIDHGESAALQWVEEILKFARSDLLCYRAETPRELVLLQDSRWSPFLDWIGTELGARFAVARGVMAINQPSDVLAALRRRVQLLDPWRLIGARRATELTGSAILGLAVEAGAFPAADVFSAARLDERFQGEKWGEDEEALARERRIEGEFLMIARWLELLGS